MSSATSPEIPPPAPQIDPSLPVFDIKEGSTVVFEPYDPPASDEAWEGVCSTNGTETLCIGPGSE